MPMASRISSPEPVVSVCPALLRLIAIQLLASCYTWDPSFWGSSLSESPTVNKGEGPPITVLHLHVQQRFCPAFGHNACNSSRTSTLPFSCAGPMLEDILADRVSQQRLKRKMEKESLKVETIQGFLDWSDKKPTVSVPKSFQPDRDCDPAALRNYPFSMYKSSPEANLSRIRYPSDSPPRDLEPAREHKGMGDHKNVRRLMSWLRKRAHSKDKTKRVSTLTNTPSSGLLQPEELVPLHRTYSDQELKTKMNLSQSKMASEFSRATTSTSNLLQSVTHKPTHCHNRAKNDLLYDYSASQVPLTAKEYLDEAWHLTSGSKAPRTQVEFPVRDMAHLPAPLSGLRQSDGGSEEAEGQLEDYRPFNSRRRPQSHTPGALRSSAKPSDIPSKTTTTMQSPARPQPKSNEKRRPQGLLEAALMDTSDEDSSSSSDEDQMQRWRRRAAICRVSSS